MPDDTVPAEINQTMQVMPIAPIADEALLRIAEKAEKLTKAMEVIIKFCILRTTALDWVDEGGKPYLQASGAQKVALPLGIQQEILYVKFEEIGEGHRNYEAKGRFTFQGNSIEEIGTRSSRDSFFTKGGKIPASEVDMNDVKKSAITNCIGRGITNLLGLRNMTWEQLRGYGLQTDKIGKVDYQTTTKAESGETTDNRAEIRRMVLEMTGGKDAVAKEMLQELTSFIPKGKTEKDRVKGKSSVADLSEAAVNVTYGKVKTKYEEWKKAGGAPQGGEGVSADDIFVQCEANIGLCETIEDVNSIVDYAIKNGVEGERLTALRKTGDKKKVAIREAAK